MLNFFPCVYLQFMTNIVKGVFAFIQSCVLWLDHYLSLFSGAKDVNTIVLLSRVIHLIDWHCITLYLQSVLGIQFLLVCFSSLVLFDLYLCFFFFFFILPTKSAKIKWLPNISVLQYYFFISPFLHKNKWYSSMCLDEMLLMSTITYFFVEK